jgi:hypothetical protein
MLTQMWGDVDEDGRGGGKDFGQWGNAPIGEIVVVIIISWHATVHTRSFLEDLCENLVCPRHLRLTPVEAV